LRIHFKNDAKPAAFPRPSSDAVYEPKTRRKFERARGQRGGIQIEHNAIRIA
jgi:hypothetical protein